jgi:reverse gyrase
MFDEKSMVKKKNSPKEYSPGPEGTTDVLLGDWSGTNPVVRGLENPSLIKKAAL